MIPSVHPHLLKMNTLVVLLCYGMGEGNGKVVGRGKEGGGGEEREVEEGRYCSEEGKGREGGRGEG